MSLAALLSAAAWPAAVSVCLLERLGYPMWLGKDPNQDVLFFAHHSKVESIQNDSLVPLFLGSFPQFPPVIQRSELENHHFE